MSLFSQLSQDVKGKNIRIVYPESTDVRVLGAAVRLKADGLVEPILIGDPEEIEKVAADNGWNVDNLTVYNPATYDEYDEMIEAFLERRDGKNTREQAVEMVKDPVYFGTMLVQMDKADGLVCGAVYTTGDTVRPALQIIKTREGVSRISGSFIMIPPIRDGQMLVFADCAINIDPDAQALADIAIESAKTAEMFGIEPRVAMLSFSSKGSASDEKVDKVVEATKLAQAKNTGYPIDGELQFDTAYDKAVAAQKVPESDVAGQATVFVFPDIQAGNIGYKIAQRLGNYEAIGPILQGLNKPVSDLSRGCSEEDVYKLSIITAVEAVRL